MCKVVDNDMYLETKKRTFIKRKVLGTHVSKPQESCINLT